MKGNNLEDMQSDNGGGGGLSLGLHTTQNSHPDSPNPHEVFKATDAGFFEMARPRNQKTWMPGHLKSPPEIAKHPTRLQVAFSGGVWSSQLGPETRECLTISGWS